MTSNWLGNVGMRLERAVAVIAFRMFSIRLQPDTAPEGEP